MQRFPATELRAPIRTREQIERTARNLVETARIRTSVTFKRRSPSVIDRTRLKTPWLTVYPNTFLSRSEWKEWERTVIRFYLNAPAHALIFPKKSGVHLPKDAYLTIDRGTDELLIGWRKGGHPVVIHTNTSCGFRHSFIAATLIRLGYLLDDEPTYFPLRQTGEGLIADLSTAYSKAAAIDREEDLCRATDASRRRAS